MDDLKVHLEPYFGGFWKPLSFAVAALTAGCLIGDALQDITEFKARCAIYSFVISLSFYFLALSHPTKKPIGFAVNHNTAGNQVSRSKPIFALVVIVAIVSASFDLKRHFALPFYETGNQVAGHYFGDEGGRSFNVAIDDLETFRSAIATNSYYDLLEMEQVIPDTTQPFGEFQPKQDIDFPFSTQVRVARGWNQILVADAYLEVTQYDPTVVHCYLDGSGGAEGVQNLIQFQFDVKPVVGKYRPLSVNVSNRRESESFKWGARKPHFLVEDGWTLIEAIPTFTSSGIYTFNSAVELTTDWKKNVSLKLNSSPITLCVIETQQFSRLTVDQIKHPPSKHWVSEKIETAIWNGEREIDKETVEVWHLVDGTNGTEPSERNP